uniref:Glutaredoxin-related protein 5, mitochondrial n=2 Tax=Hydra vulgaris TaxID=6087 RepID=T2MAP3_HYDVU|nr:glutaredoxin-related protein 5, mitochondrial [Hydra vulgaris]
MFFNVMRPLSAKLMQQAVSLPYFNGCITGVIHQKQIFAHINHNKCFSSGIDWSDNKFKEIVNNNKLVVFMKGTPDAPKCGFSKYVIQILNMHGCENFKSFNVLEDETLRSRVKEFSNWPTIPQVYINGEFIGGFDILLQMHQSGELINELDKIGHHSALISNEPKKE